MTSGWGSMAKTCREETTTPASHLCNCSHRRGYQHLDHEVKPMVNEAGLGDLTTEELAQRMWNCDETAFATDVASKRVLARRGERNVHETGGGSGREYITVLGCGSASGECLPPYVLYKEKNLWTTWTKGGPSGTYFNVSESGWMERPHFLEWFKKLFLPAASSTLETGPVILFMDAQV